jgi:hypothetical protein
MRKKWLFFILVTFLITAPDVYCKKVSGAKTVSSSLQQVGSFRLKKNADAYVRKLKEDHIVAVIKKARVKGETVYRVFAKNSRKQLKSASSSGITRDKSSSAAAPQEPGNQAKGKPEEKAEERAEVGISSREKEDNAQQETIEESPFPAESPGMKSGEEPESASYAGDSEDKAPTESPPEETTSSGNVRDNGSGGEGEVAPPSSPGESPEVQETIEKKPSAPEEKPVGTSKVTQAMFERGPKFLHADVSFTGEYTDNAFSSNENKTGGYSTIVTPEIWLLLPRSYQDPVQTITSSTRSPGGLTVSVLKPEVSTRYYSYLLYKADIPVLFHNLPSGGTITQDAQGRFIYNAGQGLYFDVFDEFSRSFETRATSISVAPGDIERFNSNLLGAGASYDTSNRTSMRFDYYKYILSFGDAAGEFRNRTDDSFAGYLYYKLMPKTSALIEAAFTDINYDNDHSLNSKEYLLEGGLQWDITAKSKGVVKAGYGVKEFDALSSKSKEFVFEAQIDHKLSAKRTVSLIAFRRTEESDIDTALFTLSTGVRIGYQQLLSPKLTGSVDLSYSNDKYSGQLLSGVNPGHIETNSYLAGLVLQYNFSKHLRSDVGYTFTRRDANSSDFRFTSNSFYLRLTGSL